MDKKVGFMILLIALVVLGLVVWGLAGAQEAKSPGVTCDVGLGELFCWKWHTNPYGQAAEFVEDVFGK
jgi:hypothetical protein